jgi:YD repeat-containing protein
MADTTGTTTYEYDALNRLTSVTFPGSRSIGYSFDDNGNLTDRGSDDFAWDAEDRLTSAPHCWLGPRSASNLCENAVSAARRAGSYLESGIRKLGAR